MRRILTQWERVLWGIALICGLVSGVAWEQAHAASRQAAKLVRTADTVPVIRPGVVLGELRIPALDLTVPMIEGDSTESLLRGVGHISGTAMAGGLGTVALAGHRDTFLRSLQRLQLHTPIDLTQGGATYRYVVDSTEIVHPEQVQVLETQNTPELVLVTCYPFHYIGHAPLRFIVNAHLVSLLPEQAPDKTAEQARTGAQ